MRHLGPFIEISGTPKKGHEHLPPFVVRIYVYELLGALLLIALLASISLGVLL